MQKAYFPMEYLRVTQGRSVGSHTGTFAFDFGGKDGGRDRVFAPCDMRIIRVRRGSDSGEVYAQSVAPVLLPDGTSSLLHFTFIHDDAVQVTEGQIVKQGEYFYDEGGRYAGKSGYYAAHLHMEVGKGASPAYQFKNDAGSWMTPNTGPIELLLWLRPDTIVLNAGGYSWTVEKQEDDPMDKNNDAVLQVGPASAGDRVAMASLAASLGLPMSETEEGLMYIGPASSGDQAAIIEKAEGLGLPVSEYDAPQEDERDKQIAELEKELVAVNEQLATTRKELATTAEERDKLERAAERYYTAIKAAVAALEV